MGLFSVRPDLQAKGYRRSIIYIADNYAFNNWNIEYLEAHILNLRNGFIIYYTKIFALADSDQRIRCSTYSIDCCENPKRKDLEFIIFKNKFDEIK